MNVKIIISLLLLVVLVAATTTFVVGSYDTKLYYVRAEQEDVTIATTNTTLIGDSEVVDTDKMNECSVNIYNANVGETLTCFVAGGNKDSPGTTWSSASYAELGSVTVAPSSSGYMAWASNWRSTIVICSATGATSSDVDAYLLCNR